MRDCAFCERFRHIRMVTRLLAALLVLAAGFTAIFLERGEWWLAPIMTLAFGSLFFGDLPKILVVVPRQCALRDPKESV